MSRKIKAEELDRLFDEGKEDVLRYADTAAARRINRNDEVRRVNVDMPSWMVEELDEEAKRMAVPRQAVIKRLIDDGLRRQAALLRV